MNLEILLEQKKSVITEKWFDFITKTYSPDTSHFLKNKKDPFANPAGAAFSQNLTDLLDKLIKGSDPETLVNLLDPIIRIRAIQDFSPSQAIAFVFSLKKIIRKSLKKNLNDGDISNELLALESKIDELGMLAFDVYMSCREKIYSLKANEEKSKVFKAFKRAGLITEITEDGPDLMESNIL
jgi:hypothetical protein